jgi:ABC-type Fe3+-hydroxamate transport system substrate-binding protein
VRDDLGHPIRRAAAATRVVSLVPSLTESIAATRPESLVGATDWCTHPADLAVTRVRGTKNPDLAAVLDLRPDLVVANREENRKRDVDALRAAGVEVWVTVVETLEAAFSSLRRLFVKGLGWPEPPWIAQAEQQWHPAAPLPHRSVVVPVWRDPWMVVGNPTFTGDIVSRLGLVNRFGVDAGRYPKTDLAAIRAAQPDLVVLPDEPYRFCADDGPEAFPGTPVALVDGRNLTWYGPSLVTARETLVGQLGAARVF